MIVLAGIAPVSLATTAPSCTPFTYDATEVAGLYQYGSELWQESNGIPGLQRVNTICSDGSSLPRDTCILHKQTSAAATCANSFGQSLA